MEYLHLNPGAADTIVGIASWWFEEDSLAEDDVERVVSLLVDEGVMERRPTPDGAAIYGLARRS